MLWLYWRRSRLIIGLTAVAVGALTGLALLADSLAGSETLTRQPAAIGGAGAQPRYAVPSSDDPQVRRGLLLISAAASACRSVSYRGVQIVAWMSPGGSSSYLIDVWHRSGEPELAGTDSDADDRSDSNGIPGGTASGAGAVGVLNISPGMLSLLRSNYVVQYVGPGSSSDRPALIVAVRRHDGTLAAQYWLDRDTGLPLRREMFDETGRRVSEGAFIDLQISRAGIGAVPRSQGQAWDTYVSPEQSRGSRLTAARVRTLRAAGWPVPRTLAGNMTLASVSKTATRSGPVLDVSYSDGLSVVSLFLQRGELSVALPGWHHVAIGGLPVYSTRSGDLDEQGLAWSAGGYVYTVIADAPPQAITRVIAALPHERDTGFLDRVARGIRRIGSWFDPFG